MNGKSARASKTGAADASPADEMAVGLPRRGDGMLPIVGLGGSAGGIAALQEFFAAMPADSGMAFVVILHLSPHHESTLAEMFQRSTAMPVAAATDGATVEPNAVYVIPPGKFLASVDGHLRLTVAQESHGKRVAVDYFFRTLAETHGAQSLAVVLSGAGGDGALGLKRVKELGGLTIAQDPDEAEHPDMPRAAIATGVVDWVLGVKEMPAKLIAYVKHRRELKLPGEDGPHPAEKVELSPDEREAALRDVLAFLHTRTGRDFSCYKRATIVRRIARRMQVNGFADLPGYLVYLRTHAGEAGALLQDLLISVTNFFRDPEAFAAVERTIPALFKDKAAGDTVRVWVAGCATGEEAYSIAMLLSEHAATLMGPPQLQVFATDLQEDVIREAREGLYPETIAADVNDERLRHFFIHEQGGYRVRRAVRELVLFAPHDLLKDSPFSRLDLVSCRNLLIYLNREAQSRAFDIFHFALRPGGRLFLGTSEAVDEGSPLFAVVDKKQRLYAQRPGPQRLIAVPAGQGTLARALALQERTRERPTVPGRVTVEDVQTGMDRAVPFDSGLPPGELHYRLIERFSPPSILVNSAHDIVHLSESAGRFLQFTGGEPTRNLLRTVHPMLRVELRAALYAAVQTHTTATAFRVPVETGDVRSLVDIRVTHAGDLAPDFLLVVFEEHPADGAAGVAAPRSADADQAALHLERELVATKVHLRETIEEAEASTEELKASNEELQAMNEELRSATEELETSREELQSINEELRTVNDALKTNVDQLARSNNDLQNLMAATDIATVFLDRDLHIQRFTPSAKTLFNFIPTDLGRPLADLSRKLDYPEIVADAERSLAHLQPIQREVSAGERWYIARTHPFRTDNDHIVGVVVTFLDITAQKETESALRESEERAAFVRRSTGVGFWYCDLPFDVLQWDELVKAHFHLPPDAAVTIQTFYDRIHPDDREPTRLAIERSIADRTPYNVDYRTVAPDTGAVKWVRAIGRTFYAADGTPTRFDGVTLDVSDQKRVEQALRDSETYFRSMADTSPSMLWVTDPTGQCTYISRQWCEYTGTSLEQNMGFGWLACVHPDDRQRAGDVFRESNRQGWSFAFDYRLRRHDDEYRWAMDAGQPRFDVTGRFNGYIGTVSDIHDRKRAEEELKNADRRKDEFLATLAHELRNPLAPIRNGLQVMRMAGASGTIEQARSMMERQLGQMVRLVDDLLDVSRVTTGKLTLSTDRLEMRAVIDAAVETSRPVIDQAGHELAVVIPDEPIFVEGDFTRLTQVVSNLLSNSAKYTHSRGHIRITVKRDGDSVLVSVKDDGIGVPPAMLGRVFEMFIQVDRTLEKTTGGLGIGLSLVKGLVEMHGGTIVAKSEGEGRGSEFVVTLPAAAPVAAGPEMRSKGPEGIVPSGRRRVLVVDDNRDAADSLTQLLELLGNEVRTANDGEAGVRAAESFRPDVVLMDIGMPKLNGYEACRRIREQRWGKDIVLVALTGWGQDGDRAKSEDAGFNFHLVKPVELAALTKLLAGLPSETS